MSSEDFPVSTVLLSTGVLGLSAQRLPSVCYIDSRHPNSGPHTCLPTLPTEPSSQLGSGLLIKNISSSKEICYDLNLKASPKGFIVG